MHGGGVTEPPCTLEGCMVFSRLHGGGLTTPPQPWKCDPSVRGGITPPCPSALNSRSIIYIYIYVIAKEHGYFIREHHFCCTKKYFLREYHYSVREKQKSFKNIALSKKVGYLLRNLMFSFRNILLSRKLLISFGIYRFHSKI